MPASAEPRYKGLIFDFFGVLTFHMVEVISSFEDREGLARGTFLRSWADPQGQELFRRLELGELTQTDWNNGFAALTGAAPDNLTARYLHDVFPAHQVLKVARQARAAGIRTAVLSNSLGRKPYDPYAGFDLHGTFDVVVLSAEHRVRKPDAPSSASPSTRSTYRPSGASSSTTANRISPPPTSSVSLRRWHWTRGSWPAASVNRSACPTCRRPRAAPFETGAPAGASGFRVRGGQGTRTGLIIEANTGESGKGCCSPNFVYPHDSYTAWTAPSPDSGLTSSVTRSSVRRSSHA